MFTVQRVYHESSIMHATAIAHFGQFKEAIRHARKCTPDATFTYRVVTGNRVIYINALRGREHLPTKSAPRGVILANHIMVFGGDKTFFTTYRDMLAGAKEAKLP